MAHESLPIPAFYTNDFLIKAEQALQEGFGINKADISSNICEQVYLYLLTNINE